MRVARISFKNKIAGFLAETTGGGTRFTYNPDWDETIACILPISRREHEWPSGLHPFFQHLGPEGWLREHQARVSDIAEEDDFGLLLSYGADCIGAVGVLPMEETVSPIEISAATPNPRRTISGVQRKLLMVRDEGTHDFLSAPPDGLAPYIAKFNSENLPTLVRNEHLSLKWISVLLGKDQVTDFQLAPVPQFNERALIVTRFDRTEDGQKLRAEDFAQVLGKPRGQDFTGKYDSSYEEVAEIIRNHSARPQIDLAKFFRRLVAFAIVSNGDAHLKNFTLLEQPEGLRLSPVYDVVNVGLYANQGYSQRFGLAIGNELLQIDAVTKPVLVAFGTRIGLSKTMIDRVFQDTKSGAKKAEKLLPNLSEDMDPFGAGFSEIVRNGCLRLLEE